MNVIGGEDGTGRVLSYQNLSLFLTVVGDIHIYEQSALPEGIVFDRFDYNTVMSNTTKPH